MSSRISSIFPFLLITLLCVGGVEAFYFVVERYVLTVEETASTEQEEITVERRANVKAAPEVVDHGIITERNIFGPPPDEKGGIDENAFTEPTEELEATTLAVVLMGTVHGTDDGNRAVILNKKDRKQEIYSVGDSVQGALIKEIQRGKIVLTVDGKDESLDMSEASKYGSTKTRGPVAAVSPRRRLSTTAPPAQVGESEDGEQVQTRVVRPRRRIVRPQRSVTADLPEVQPEDVEEIQEIVEDQDVPEDAEVVENGDQDVPEDAETVEAGDQETAEQ